MKAAGASLSLVPFVAGSLALHVAFAVASAGRSADVRLDVAPRVASVRLVLPPRSEDPVQESPSDLEPTADSLLPPVEVLPVALFDLPSPAPSDPPELEVEVERLASVLPLLPFLQTRRSAPPSGCRSGR